MKLLSNKKITLAFSMMLFLAGQLFSQETCKVLLESLAGEYAGDCKKGLADGTGTATGTDTYTGEFKKGLPDGKGVYTWANGDVYDGEFKKGQKSGAGKLTTKTADGMVKEQKGFWDKDEYIGEHENPYKVMNRTVGVLSVHVSETENPANDGDALFIEILHKGRPEGNAVFALSETMGSFMTRYPAGTATKVIVGTFPFGFTLGYMNETVEMAFYKKGSWRIRLDFNK